MIIESDAHLAGSAELARTMRASAARLRAARSPEYLRANPMKQAEIWGIEWFAADIEREMAEYLVRRDTAVPA